MTVQLETRACKCGCGETFRVMPSSKMEFAGKKHEAAYKKRGSKPLEPTADFKPDEAETRDLRKLANIFGVKKG